MRVCSAPHVTLYERLSCLRVLRALRRAGNQGMSRSELTRATQALRPAEREEILNSLVTSHEVELVQGEVGINGKRPTRYICRGG